MEVLDDHIKSKRRDRKKKEPCPLVRPLLQREAITINQDGPRGRCFPFE